MSSTPNLSNLLPSIYRVRDSSGALGNLFAILQDAHDSVDRDIASLYDNWFIETCAEWVVPYIGDLLGVPVLQSSDIPGVTARGYVAQTLSYRRRKGTAVVLEQLARDVTNWPAYAVECFKLLSTTQYMQHLRPSNIATLDLRDVSRLATLGGAWDAAARTADLRSITDASLSNLAINGVGGNDTALRGKPNLSNVALYLWRLGSYSMQGVTPRPVTNGADGRYLLHPGGLSAPLFNPGQALPAFTAPAGEQDLPAALRRLALASDLEGLRQALVDGNMVWTPNTDFALGSEIVDANGNTQRVISDGTTGAAAPSWPVQVNDETGDGSVTWQLASLSFAQSSSYFGSQPVLQVFRTATDAAVPPEQLSICDLNDVDSAGNWRTLAPQRTYTRASDGAQITLPIQAAVDPELGRLAFAAGSFPTPGLVRADYSYGFSGELGGGPYNRINSLKSALAGINTAGGDGTYWQVAVSNSPALVAEQPGIVLPDLATAVDKWNALSASGIRFGVITLLDNSTYVSDLTGEHTIQLPDATSLLIVAAAWPSLAESAPPASLALSPLQCRPYLQGSIAVKGTAPSGSENPGSLLLNGLLVEGTLTVQGGNLGQLQLTHCTLIPGTVAGASGDLIIEAGPGAAQQLQNAGLQVLIARSILGSIQFSDDAAGAPALSVTDSIIGGSNPVVQVIHAPQADATIVACTILGGIGATGVIGLRTLTTSNSIFAGLVQVERTQTGCARYCSFTADSTRLPRRFRCQPELATASISDPSAAAAASIRLTPSFTSLRYGDPAYAQLSAGCAPEVRAGADDGSEMGAFSFLKQPQRDANLRSVLSSYLRPPFQAGIFYVN